MTGAVQGLIGSYKAAAAPAYKRCTTFQISIACCTGTGECGTLGAGASCSPANGIFNPDNC